MKINNTSAHKPSFKAHIVNNKALRILVKDVRTMYGGKYLRTVAKKVKDIGSDSDEIKFVYSTWAYQKGLGMKQLKEGVTFVLFNDKHVGHFENRFLSNFLAQTKNFIKEHDTTKASLEKTLTEKEVEQKVKIKKESIKNKTIKIFKKLTNMFFT